MATFSFKTFGQLLQDMIDTMTANAATVTNFGEGAVTRVLFEAVAGRLDYFTILLKRILLLCRLATSTGSDVDSFTTDYGMSARLQAVKAFGAVTFSRLISAPTPVFIPVGATVSTYDNSISFEVIADTANVNYDGARQGYTIAANTTSVGVTVRAKTAGKIGNIAANTLTVIGSNLIGVDGVTNAAAYTNGQDAETDAEMRARFVKYIASLARATKGAIEYAIIITQNNLKYVVKENVDINGVAKLGYITIVIDDGSGIPPASLLTAVSNNINLYRGYTIQYGVNAPTVLTTNASLSIAVHAGYTLATVQTAVQSAISNYMSSLTFEEFMSPERLAAIAFSVAGVKDVNSPLLNGSTADIQPLFNQIIKPGTITVS